MEGSPPPLPSIPGQWRCGGAAAAARRSIVSVRLAEADRGAEADLWGDDRVQMDRSDAPYATEGLDALECPFADESSRDQKEHNPPDLAGSSTQGAFDQELQVTPRSLRCREAHGCCGGLSAAATDAVILCADERSQVQALDRSQPGLPLIPGRCGTYARVQAARNYLLGRHASRGQ